MKKIIYILVVFFCAYLTGNQASNIVTNFAKFILPNCPNWLEAGYYGSILYSDKSSDQKSDKISTQEICAIRSILKKYNFEPAFSITIECANSSVNAYMHHAISCTPAKLLINPKIYNQLTEQEKEASIVHALVRLENSHIATHLCALAIIPFCTEFLTSALQYSFSHIKTDNKTAQQALHLINKIAQFPVTKFCINLYLTNSYFKSQELRYDLATVRRLKNYIPLARLYEKTHTLIKDKSYLLSMRQPSLESRIQYLSAYKHT